MTALIRLLSFLLTLGQLLLTSCTMAPPASPSTPRPVSRADDVATADSERQLEDLFRSRGDGSQAEGDYRIGPGDTIILRVFGVAELSGRYTVSRDGTILVPLVDEVRAEGQTEEGLARALAMRLGERHLESPDVEVSVEKFEGQRVAVLGAVKNPGFYPVANPGASILDFINQAGGLNRQSGTRLYFTPARPSKDGPMLLASNAAQLENPIEIDLTPFVRGRLARALSLPVRPGDVLYVEEAGQVVVDGWVTAPRAIQIRPGLTLVQAIADAGGLHFAASRGNVVLSRKGRGRPGETLRYEYDELAAAHRRDVPLQAGDRIYVGGHPVKVPTWAVYSVVTGLVNVAFGGFIPLF